MSDEDHDIMVTQFQDITGQDVERSRFYLESSGWDLELALGSFYESDAMEVEDFEAARPQASSQPSPAKPKEDKTPEKAKPGSGASSKPLGSSSGSSSSNINTFSSRFGSSASKQADDEDSDESDDEGQAFYAGGSRTSGQQVLGPSKKKEGADFVKHMFKRAREHGAEALDPNTPGGSGGAARQVFMGSGFRLGSNEGTSDVIPGAAVKKDEKPREFILKMWQNGFSIDDGPLRAYNDQQNREFLNDVMMGRIPRELVREARGGEVMVNMEDHKDQQFEPSKAKVKPFQGSGNVLGNMAPEIASNTTSAAEPVGAALSPEDAQKKVNVDPSKPMTSIQIRLASGGRLIAKMNESSTISDLRRYIRLVNPESPVNFSLHTTFPNKELTDETVTLKDAGILGAAVLTRAK